MPSPDFSPPRKKRKKTRGKGLVRAAAAVDAGLPLDAPDFAEEEQFDNMIPTRGYQMMPMVGIGGSAGSISALQAFFEAFPADANIVFVVVLHLAPDYASTLPEMIQKWTPMRVQQAEDGVKVEGNCVYVIPPGKHLTAVNGHLKLTDLDREKGRRVAVDLFFRSLADTHGPHAAAVVLSGADGDGGLGIKRIKERGGLTIAQDPDEAEHESMPRSAIATGMVDWVLRTVDMPQRILEYIASEKRLHLPPEDGPQPTDAPRPARGEPEAALREILVFLRARTGRDFSYYKRATILRRISRRMQVNGIMDTPAYLAFLRTHPGESGALLQDLLISVTNFFRDREAFAALQKRIPALFEGKGQGDTVRVWVPACATGEEAYSLAILLLEHARTLDLPPGIQVFGCDLDEDGVQSARAGIYPEAIAADVSEERLERFFIKEHRGYRVRREVREVVLFAAHDLLKDAPFSRLDLISCRNLLIYLNRDAQARAFDMFHFALKPGGLLFLGSSESVEDGTPFFRVLDKKNRIYLRKSTPRIGLPVPTGPSRLSVRQPEQPEALEPAGQPPVAPRAQSGSLAAGSPRPSAAREEDRLSWADLHFKLIERFAPPSVLINARHEVQHLSESAGRFLQLVGGMPTTNLLRLVAPELRVELRGALHRAAQTGESAEVFRVPVDLEGQRRLVDMKVFPAKDLAPDFLLVTFHLWDAGSAQEEGAAKAPAESEPMLQHLERELEEMKGHLRDTVDQYEASNEELKANNEELQAMNEELRSASEELETSREELQSINEELTTVNQELKNKVDELGHANSDLQNLMGATAIATLFLDREMRIMRFTPFAAPIFNLIPGDIGRPLSDLQHHIDYPEMHADADRVLEKLTPVERQVSGAEGACYLARMLPYRTVDDHIAGVVLTFVDITERQRVERALAEDLEITERLRKASERTAAEGEMQGLFAEILDAAIGILKADAGTMQLLQADTETLLMLASKGLSPDMVRRFAKVEAKPGSSCGMVLETGARSFVDFDDPNSPDPDGSKKAHVEAGLHSTQSTPLIARSGRTVGLLSTHWREHRRPTDRQLSFLDLLARQAADAIERQQASDVLHVHMQELTRFNDAAVGREARIINLKKEINELAARHGEPPRYPLEFEKEN